MIYTIHTTSISFFLLHLFKILQCRKHYPPSRDILSVIWCDIYTHAFNISPLLYSCYTVNNIKMYRVNIIIYYDFCCDKYK